MPEIPETFSIKPMIENVSNEEDIRLGVIAFKSGDKGTGTLSLCLLRRYASGGDSEIEGRVELQTIVED